MRRYSEQGDGVDIFDGLSLDLGVGVSRDQEYIYIISKIDLDICAG
jgi:hypothetical protein